MSISSFTATVHFMLSQTVEYALRSMAVLAQASPNAKRTSEIARIAKVPPAYLVKILQSLIRAGLVQSKRGVSGGVTLNKAPEQISILDVVNAVDPVPRIRTCPLGLKAHGIKLCPLHSKMDAVLESMEKSFSTTNLSEIIETKVARLNCAFPPHTSSKAPIS